MSSPLLDELHWLTQALRAHVEWTASTGGHAVPRCDATWLDQRREHYRTTALRDANNLAWLPIPDETTQAHEATPHVAPLPLAETELAPTPVAETSERSPRVAATAGPLREQQRDGTSVTHASNSVQSVLGALGSNASPTPRSVERLRQPADNSSPRASAAINLPTGLGAEQKQARLVTMAQEVDACISCGLCSERKRPAFARGTGNSGIVFVGEGPGAEEDAQGVPFVGAAGQLLDRMIGAMGLSRDDVYVCNIIKCRPPNNRKPTDDEIAACRHFVVEQLHLIEPRVIVALGATAVEGLLGLKLGITRLRGTWRLYEGRIPVMPTFHPAYLLRKPEAKREVWEDLQAVLARVNRPTPSRS